MTTVIVDFHKGDDTALIKGQFGGTRSRSAADLVRAWSDILRLILFPSINTRTSYLIYRTLAAAQGMRSGCSWVCGQRMSEGSRGLRMCLVFDRGLSRCLSSVPSSSIQKKMFYFSGITVTEGKPEGLNLW